MKIFKQLILIGTVLTFLSISAYAEDTITVRYLDGYPLPGVSSEGMNLRISRTGAVPGVAPASRQDVDQFFEDVSATLTVNKVGKDWQLAQQSETFRLHRIAFEKILSLALERVDARLLP